MPFNPYNGNWVHLGSTVFATTTTASEVVEFPPFDILKVFYRITGYGGAAIASFRFGPNASGVIDAGANYWYRHASIAAGVATVTNTQAISQTFVSVAAIAVAQGRVGEMIVSNYAGANVSKVVRFSNQTQSAATPSAATAGVVEFGGGEWINTANRITMIQMVDNPTTTNINAGTGFSVFGMNLS